MSFGNPQRRRQRDRCVLGVGESLHLKREGNTNSSVVDSGVVNHDDQSVVRGDNHLKECGVGVANEITAGTLVAEVVGCLAGGTVGVEIGGRKEGGARTVYS